MTKLIFKVMLLVLGIGNTTFSSAAKGHLEQHHLHADGPYLLFQPNNQLRSISVNAKREVVDTVIQLHAQRPYVFPVFSDEGTFLFDVPLRKHTTRDAYSIKPSKRIFITSDPHGDWKSFSDLLVRNGVVDRDYGWSYGKNQLVVIGDVFDRGHGVMSIFWLLYKLEAEAEKVGGKVIFVLGNHEPMVTGGDLRYVKKSYLELAKQLDMPYEQLVGRETVLGEWLAHKNTMQLLGKNLIVHAGISRDVLERCYTIPQINERISEGLFYKNSTRRKQSMHLNFLYGNKGPIWFRGMVSDKERYFPIAPTDVKLVLRYFKVKRIIVGHTIFPEISSFFNQKVVAVNVDNKKNRKKHRSRAIVIEKNRIYVVKDDGLFPL